MSVKLAIWAHIRCSLCPEKNARSENEFLEVPTSFMKEYQLTCRGKKLLLSDEPVIMGILNVTPDSFSDGGKFSDPAVAVKHGLTQVAEGAGIIDIGGQSTRPGARPVAPQEQIKRVVAVIEELARQIDVLISIDTTDSEVAAAALEAGASIINDISAGRFDSRMMPLAARYGVPIILMHMQGQPQTMQQYPVYENVVKEVYAFLAERIDFAVSAGVNRSQIVIDPGIGFGKTLEHNLQLLRHIDQLHLLDVPILIGPSRKAFIGKILGLADPADRLFGTAGAVAWCAGAGTHILRVHDVREMAHVARLTAAIRG